MNRIERFCKIREEFINEILNDNSLSKVEKLQQLTDLRLWGVDCFISGFSDGWETECAIEEERRAIADGKEKGKDYICGFCDCPLYEDYDRHSVIYYVDIIERALENREEDGTILVATCRGDYHSEIYKTADEVIDHIFDFAVENKSIGFELDW